MNDDSVASDVRPENSLAQGAGAQFVDRHHAAVPVYLA